MPPEAIAAILGVFLPPVVSLLKRPGWSKQAKLVVAGIASLAVGVFSTWAGGEAVLTDPATVFISATSAFTVATAVYKAWFESAKVLGVPLNEKLTSFILL